MCKKCVQSVKSVCKELWEIVGLPQVYGSWVANAFLPTSFYTRFPVITHKFTADAEQMYSASFPTLSTAAITTTILINNKEVAGRKGNI